MNLSTDSRIVRAALWVAAHPMVWRIIGTGFFAVTVIFAAIWIGGKDVEPITFALSLCSTFFFALPAIADLFIKAKPVSQMSFEEIMDFVERSDPKADWQSVSITNKEEVFCLRDTKLRIVHHTGDEGVQNEDFQEPWANKFPDPKATGFWYDVEYDGGCLRRMLIVAVDGYRAYLPCPKVTEMTVSKLQDAVGRIIATDQQRYAEYKERAGIKTEA